ncbi:MAG: hypothetical protein CMJ31_00005, partial [Phycisphaerae bacterium]|nr:hypothetical protein [Phycisphaerae bacterium]
DDDPRGMIAALAGQDGVCAKIRCGGVKPEMIPPAEQVAGFVAACATAAVPFKATAGLHHPIRGEYPLTYDKNPPKAVMHGFINLVVGAAMIRKRLIDQPTLVELLEETHPKAFELTTDDAIVWRGVKLDLVSLADARERFFIGYGSCSYAEPIDDLRGLGWL